MPTTEKRTIKVIEMSPPTAKAASIVRGRLLARPDAAGAAARHNHADAEHQSPDDGAGKGPCRAELTDLGGIDQPAEE